MHRQIDLRFVRLTDGWELFELGEEDYESLGVFEMPDDLMAPVSTRVGGLIVSA